MAIYKRGQEFELGTTEHKSSKWPEKDSNLGLPDCESDAVTTRPRCLPETAERNSTTSDCIFHKLAVKNVIVNEAK